MKRVGTTLAGGANLVNRHTLIEWTMRVLRSDEAREQESRTKRLGEELAGASLPVLPVVRGRRLW